MGKSMVFLKWVPQVQVGNLSGFTRQETLNNVLKGMGLIRNKTGVYLLEVIRVCEGRKSRTKEQIAKG